MALIWLQYLEHLRGIIRRALLDDGAALWPLLLRAGVAYVKAGGTAQERADRREALRTLLTLGWQLMGHAHDAHQLKHEMAAAGIAPAEAEDVPATQEPIV